MKKVTILLLFSLAVLSQTPIQRFQSETYPKYSSCLNKYLQVKGKRVHYCFHKGSTDKLFILSPGKEEMAIKYFDLVADIVKRDESFLIMDHYGQGKSEHILVNRHKSHVEDFNVYTEAFTRVVDTILKRYEFKSIDLISHSMGSFVAFEFLKQTKHKVDRTFLGAPMLKFKTKGFPRPVAKYFSWFMNFIGFGEAYAFKQGDYNPNKKFENNKGTHDRSRFEYGVTINKLFPEQTVAGATFSWVYQGMSATEKIAHNLDKIKSEIIILQAEQDSIVDNDIQKTLCDQIKHCRIEVFKNAKHDIYFELPQTREKIINMITSY